MKKEKIALLCLFFAIVLVGCQNENVMDNTPPHISPLDAEKAIIQQLGFDISTLINKGDYYLVEGDIGLKKENLKQYLEEYLSPSHNEPTLKQGIAGNNKLTSLEKVKNMTIRADASVPVSGPGSGWRTAVEIAVNAWNNVPGSCVNYIYTTAITADITVKRTDDNSDNIAWTFLPLNGVPSNEIFVNSKFDNYDNMANTIIHEMGHTIGLLHSHETPASQGDILIPGTPEIDNHSIMSYNRDRSLLPGFSENDIIAIRYLYPDNPITASAKDICQSQLITYSIRDLQLSQIITLDWVPIKNAVLVSSQGTSATFRSSGEGVVIVKANVNYNYSNYSFTVPIDHLGVWSGLVNNGPSITNIDLDPKDYVGSLTLGGNIQGATKYEWGGLFPSQYKGSKTSSIVTLTKKHIISQGGMYIFVEASNACGTIRADYNITVGGSGPGGIIFD